MAIPVVAGALEGPEWIPTLRERFEEEEVYSVSNKLGVSGVILEVTFDVEGHKVTEIWEEVAWSKVCWLVGVREET